MKDLRQVCERVAPGRSISVRILQTDGAPAALRSSQYLQVRGREIHILMSPGEYCCLSGPADAMAILAVHIVPDAPDAGDADTVSDLDHSSEPDLFG